MALITRPNDYTPDTVIRSAEVDDDLDTLYSEFNGNIDNANIKAGADIAATKIANTAIVATPADTQQIVAATAAKRAIQIKEKPSQTMPAFEIIDSSDALAYGFSSSSGAKRFFYFDRGRKNYVGFQASGNLIFRDENMGAEYILQDLVSSGSAGNASASVKGITRLSKNPVSPTAPIAVGDNDLRIFSSAAVRYNTEERERSTLWTTANANTLIAALNTSATGANLNTLVQGPNGIGDPLHRHAPEKLIGVNTSVSAVNLKTLVAGPTSNADSLHKHTPGHWEFLGRVVGNDGGNSPTAARISGFATVATSAKFAIIQVNLNSGRSQGSITLPRIIGTITSATFAEQTDAAATPFFSETFVWSTASILYYVSSGLQNQAPVARLFT